MFRLAVLVISAFALLVAGCSVAPASDNGGRSAPATRLVKNAFPEAAEVRLFVEKAIASDGNPVFSKKDGLRLSPTQRSRFEASLIIEPVPEMVIGCFIPHHFFRYFDAKGRQIGEIQVCFCCGGVEPSGEAKIQIAKGERLSADYEKLETFVRSLGESTDVQCGDTN